MNESGGDNSRWYPHVTVASIAMKDGKFLMVRERYRGNSVYNQPAGHLEAGETLTQAVIRETLEETGWEFSPQYICGIYQFVAKNGETYLRFTFAGELIRLVENAELDPAIEEVVWMDEADLQEQKMNLRTDVVLKCIADYKSGNRLPDYSVTHLTKSL